MEYLMVFPDRESAEDVAAELIDDGGFATVRVVSEAFAGEDDAEDVDWVVHVVAEGVDDPDDPAGWQLTEHFTALAEEHDGWLDSDH